MNTYVRIGDNRTFALKQAVLLYQDGSRAFATLHEVKHRPSEAPYLCAGQCVTTGFLETLAKGLGANMAAEVLPEHVLARTPDLIAWWSRARPRLMFFGDGNAETKRLNGKMYPQPALVFMIQGRELFVRALAKNCRPSANTRLCNAPYWNTDAHGRVCLGSMRVPDDIGVASLAGWENAYFASEFTHPSG
ncbi:MAG: PRTRC system protein B, partial [Terriglobales bacterium]